jgi:hypothetical protein
MHLAAFITEKLPTPEAEVVSKLMQDRSRSIVSIADSKPASFLGGT